MSNTSLCRLCGGLLKAKARRCRSCGARVQNTPTPPPQINTQTFDPPKVKMPDFTRETPTQDVVATSSPPTPPDTPVTDCTLSEKLMPLNKKRQFSYILGVIFLVPAAVLFLVSYINATESLLALSLLLGAGGGISLFISNNFTKEKKTLISSHVITGMLAEQFELYSYNPLSTFSQEEVERSELRRWHRISGNDMLAANYRGVNFHFADVKLVRQSGRSSHTVFKGQWLILDLPNEISAPLMISTLEKKGRFPRGQRNSIPTGNEHFDSKFTVLTENPELVPQIVTNSLISFLLPTNYENIDFDDPLAMSFMQLSEHHLFFKGKEAQIGIHSGRDLFEPCRNVDDIPALRERILSEMDEIKAIIDAFLQIDALFEVSNTTDDVTDESSATHS